MNKKLGKETSLKNKNTQNEIFLKKGWNWKNEKDE